MTSAACCSGRRSRTRSRGGCTCRRRPRSRRRFSSRNSHRGRRTCTRHRPHSSCGRLWIWKWIIDCRTNVGQGDAAGLAGFFGVARSPFPARILICSRIGWFCSPSMLHLLLVRSWVRVAPAELPLWRQIHCMPLTRHRSAYSNCPAAVGLPPCPSYCSLCFNLLYQLASSLHSSAT